MPRLSRALHAMVVSGSMTRREANHAMSQQDPKYLRSLTRHARDQAVSKGKAAERGAKLAAGEKVTSGRRVRRNFREY